MTKGQKKGLLVLLVFIMVLLNADSNVLAPALTRIEAEFSVTDADIGFISMLFTIIGAVVSLLWGYFSDKTSRKLLFVASVVLGELPCLLTAFVHTYPMFFLLRILCGLGVGASFPLVYSIVGDIFDDKERPSATAFLTMAAGLGQILGAGVAGFTVDAIGWRIPFILVSAPNFLFLPLFWIFIPEPQKAASEEATRALVESGVMYPKTIKVSDYAKLFKNKTNLYLFIQGIAGTFPWGAFMFINKFLEEGRGLSTLVATIVYLFFGLGMVAGSIIGGKVGASIFRKNPSRLPVFCGVTTLMAIGFISVLFWVPMPLWTLALLGFVTATCAALTGPNMRAMLLDVNAPEERGAIFSVFNLTDSLGTGIGRWFCGILSIVITLTGGLQVCVLFWIISGAVQIMTSRVFVSDMKALDTRMKSAAAEMKAAAKA
jgi:predicted MFS family arabinose efflux permease